MQINCFKMSILCDDVFERDWAEPMRQLVHRSGDWPSASPPLTAEVQLLRKTGWLKACLPTGSGGKGWGCEPQGTRDAIAALRCLGLVNCSLGRIFEGHMNAVKLVALYAHDSVAKGVFATISKGALLGVWGADFFGAPVEISSRDGTDYLVGTKQFASGLGLVAQAVITARNQSGQSQLLLLPTEDLGRQDRTAWQMSGMQATASGHYDFEGLPIGEGAMVGAPDVYSIEPHFQGGIWRYCAVHIGAAEGLTSAFCRHLMDTARANDPIQRARLAKAAVAVATGRLWVEHAAHCVEAVDASASAAVQSLMARDAVEAACLEVIALVEQGMGMAAHRAGSEADRLRRDLRLYLCQAAPDAKLQMIAQAVLDEHAAAGFHEQP